MNDLLDNQQIRSRRNTASPAKLPSRDQSSGKDPHRKESQRKESRGNNSGPKRFLGRLQERKNSPGKNSNDSGGQRAFRPAKVTSLFEQNSRIIDNVEQNPIREHHEKDNSRRNFTFPKENTQERKSARGQKTPGKKRSLSLFSTIPVVALLLLVLGFFLVNQNNGSSPEWMNREAVDSAKDPGSQYNMAVYAGIRPVERIIDETGGDIPLDVMETFTWQSYRVKRGDTVSGIAVSHSVSMDAIIASNGITNARSLREGEVLRIPNMDGIPYLVKSGDNLTGISKAMGVPIEAILDANDLQTDRINAGMTLFIPGARMNSEELKMALGDHLNFIYPVRGARLSSPFGWRDDPFGSGVRVYHGAIDLSVPQGTPIIAAMNGKISAVGFDRTYGNYVIISHPGDFQTMYAHLHTVSVKRDDQVAQGAQIGTVGTTGRSTGPHLHFALYVNGRAVNPLDFLNS